MTTAKHMGRETKKTYQDKIRNAGTYDFKDALTGLPVDADNLYDKSEITPFNAKIKHNENDIEWDSIVIEDLPADRIDEQVKAILESYVHPSFTWDKDPGQGRPIQKINVTGERPVHYDLHQEAGGYHLHLKVFRYSLDKQFGLTAWAPLDVPKCADAQLNYTNGILLQKGLPVIGESVKAFTKSPERPSEETKADVAKVVAGQKDMDEVIEKIETSTVFSEQNLDSSLSADEKELARLIQLAKQKQEEIQAKKASKNLIEENRQLKVVVADKDKALEVLEAEKVKLYETIHARTDELKEVINAVGSNIWEHNESDLTIPQLVKAKMEEKDNDYSNLQEEFDGFKVESAKRIDEVIQQKDKEKQLAINEVKADFTDKLVAKDKVAESLNIQVSEAHKRNSDLQAEINRIRADHQKQMELLKKQQEEADKQLAIEKEKTAKLIKENEEKDKKFREFATKFVGDVTEKLKTLSGAISSFAKGLTDKEQKKEANDIAKSVKTSLSDMQKQFGVKEEKQEHNTPSSHNPHKKI